MVLFFFVIPINKSQKIPNLVLRGRVAANHYSNTWPDQRRSTHRHHLYKNTTWAHPVTPPTQTHREKEKKYTRSITDYTETKHELQRGRILRGRDGYIMEEDEGRRVIVVSVTSPLHNPLLDTPGLATPYCYSLRLARTHHTTPLLRSTLITPHYEARSHTLIYHTTRHHTTPAGEAEGNDGQANRNTKRQRQNK